MMLIARDEQSCLVVSYKEVKTCIDSAFSSVLFLIYKWPAEDLIGS
jgi:PAB-dependent poly(A)-specific ribonuclease subunit 3